MPLTVRKDLGLVAGSKVSFVKQGDGYVLAPSGHSITRLAGFFGPYEGAPVTIEKMNQDIAAAMGEAS